MKNKYYLYGLFAAALTLTGCDYNEDHFPGYDELAQPKMCGTIPSHWRMLTIRQSPE